MARRLDPDESALWRQVAATVTPLAGRGAFQQAILNAPFSEEVTERVPFKVRPLAEIVRPVPPATHQLKGKSQLSRPLQAATLDASWDKRLARGVAAPDRTIDLHGHSLSSAHALLDAELGRAIRRGDRVILLVTGRPPRKESERPHARGAIRAAVADWLAASPHGSAIAAVRGAHPRHGGAGALYLVLRRPR